MKRVLGISLVCLFGLAACGDDPSAENDPLIPQTFKISECGGFEAQKLQSKAGPAAYCDAEVLDWSYDAASGTLKLSNERVLLNCCGDRKATLTENNGVYELLETDAPQNGSRCHCMCVFDLAVEGKSIPGGVIDLKLLRQVSEDGPAAKTVYTGKIDLSKGSGTVVVDATDVGFWCGQP